MTTVLPRLTLVPTAGATLVTDFTVRFPIFLTTTFRSRSCNIPAAFASEKEYTLGMNTDSDPCETTKEIFAPLAAVAPPAGS